MVMKSLRLLPLTLLLAANTGCESSAGDALPPVSGSSAACRDGYPIGAKGGNVGDVVDCFCWDGYTQPGLGLGSDNVDEVCLHDLHNPSGDAVHDGDSPFEDGSRKPLVIMISVGAGWCGPCKDEASSTFPAEYAARKPRGFELISILTDAEDSGTPATLSYLDAWIGSFDSQYPSVIDPSYSIGQIVDTTNYPANLLIDARDMTIFDKVISKPQSPFFDQTDDMLLAPAE
jgi:hypothetical protein